MTLSLVVHTLSIILQLAAGLVAFYLIKITTKKIAWTLISIAMVIQAFRRIGVVWDHYSVGTPLLLDFDELTTFAISIFAFSGILMIGDYFRAISEAERKLEKSESNYSKIFESSPIALWKIDLSEFQRSVNKLNDEISTSLEEFFLENPMRIPSYASKIKITEINEAAKNLLDARDKEIAKELLIQNLSRAAIDAFYNELRFVNSNRLLVNFEIKLTTKTGKNKDVFIQRALIADAENSLSTALISCMDITEVKESREARDRLKNQLARAKAMVETVESERKRISRDLHDGVGHLLMASNLKLDEFKSASEVENKTLDEAQKFLMDAALEIRSIVHYLHPLALDNYGLEQALSLLCENFANANNIKVHFKSYSLPKTIEKNYEVSLYRIAQEAINNSARHSGGSEIWVQIYGRTEGIYMTIEDNGFGFDYKNISEDASGFGLSNMKERAEILGGELIVESEKGRGCEIHVNVPYARKLNE